MNWRLYKLMTLRYVFWLFLFLIKKSVWSCDLTLRIYVLKENIQKVLLVLRDHSLFQCKVLSDLTAVDYPGDKYRFHLYYMLLSTNFNFRAQVITFAEEGFTVLSSTSLYSSANWSEREVWDLFGVPFKGHPDLRRILTDYGFRGFPLRKNFPLSGYYEHYYDDAQKFILKEPVELAQEFRFYRSCRF